jgi:hypothetical protein
MWRGPAGLLGSVPPEGVIPGDDLVDIALLGQSKPPPRRRRLVQLTEHPQPRVLGDVVARASDPGRLRRERLDGRQGTVHATDQLAALVQGAGELLRCFDAQPHQVDRVRLERRGAHAGAHDLAAVVAFDHPPHREGRRQRKSVGQLTPQAVRDGDHHGALDRFGREQVVGRCEERVRVVDELQLRRHGRRLAARSHGQNRFSRRQRPPVPFRP